MLASNVLILHQCLQHSQLDFLHSKLYVDRATGTPVRAPDDRKQQNFAQGICCVNVSTRPPVVQGIAALRGLMQQLCQAAGHEGCQRTDAGSVIAVLGQHFVPLHMCGMVGGWFTICTYDGYGNMHEAFAILATYLRSYAHDQRGGVEHPVHAMNPMMARTCFVKKGSSAGSCALLVHLRMQYSASCSRSFTAFLEHVSRPAGCTIHVVCLRYS
jgi:hypothetical protein